jgi:hypothetical protein
MAQYLSQTRDGFQLTTNRFEFPEGILTLDPPTKRDIAICHLFLNRRMDVLTWRDHSHGCPPGPQSVRPRDLSEMTLSGVINHAITAYGLTFPELHPCLS